MPQSARRVGLDLGTTYSALSVLTPSGSPKTVEDVNGDAAVPSVVLFEPGGKAVVGEPAAAHAVADPGRVVQQAKRFLHDPQKRWLIGRRRVSPSEVTALIVRHLLDSARPRFGDLKEAVITVPVQFGHDERSRTVRAAKAAGLESVTLIDEPVAAALCHVLAGSEAEGAGGLWFAELADAQTVLVFDLGGGTLDLAVVRYGPGGVEVVANGGDPHLGGVDFTGALSDALAGQFAREFSDAADPDPRDDPHSAQALRDEVEKAKRALSVRDETPVTISHAGNRKTYRVERGQFEAVTAPLLKRAETLVVDLVKRHTKGWGEIDAVLLTGGSSRIPSVRAMLKRLSGTTPNTALSPDQSVAHGACLYAGLLSQDAAFARNLLGDRADDGGWEDKLARNVPRQRTARGLGVLVRGESGRHEPAWVIPPNSPVPAAFRQTFGTVKPNQTRVRIRVVQAGPTPDAAPTGLGDCVVEPLPPDLPENAPVVVTLRLDEAGIVRTEAVEQTTGKRAHAELRSPSEHDLPAPDASAAPAGTSPTPPDISTTAALKTPAGTAPAAPAEGRTGKEAEEGADEFWNIVGPEVKPKRRRRARANRRA